MDQVTLYPGLPGGRWACLRPMVGHDESFAIEAATRGTSLGDVAQASGLLARLLVAAPGTTVTPERLGELAVCDRDRLLAAVYRQCFGDRVEGQVPCRQCDEGFELSFSLAELEASRSLPGQSWSENLKLSSGPDSEGFFRLNEGADDGRHFRLPTVADLESVLGLDPEASRAELLARCLADGTKDSGDAEAVDAAMAEAGPVLDLDLDAVCSECGAEQSVHFDVVNYLLAALRREQGSLHREVHCLARVYGWSWNEILGLPRDERRAYVRLINAEQARAQRASGVRPLGEWG